MLSDQVRTGGADELGAWYRIRVPRSWFRGKDVFAQRLNQYERQLLKYPKVAMPLDAGNMIYTMMRKLTAGSDWSQQSALMSAYRNLVYRLSRVTAFWYQSDVKFISLEGQKSDVMWAITFISQVFFEEPMSCYLSSASTQDSVQGFSVQNGAYVERGKMTEEDLPDIWDEDSNAVKPAAYAGIRYDPSHVPQPGEKFATLDGRVSEYVRMDVRFQLGKTKGANMQPLERHNITASLIKDFQDMTSNQKKDGYDVFQMRYQAFMNKVHALEALCGGLEPSAYDMMPIAERGLPVASAETITRTNAMDKNSLRYAYDNLTRQGVTQDDAFKLAQDAVTAVMMRQNGYECEYKMYTATGTGPELAGAVFRDQMGALYEDFMKLDALNIVLFPAPVYRNLCNVPASGGPVMSEWEQQRIRVFGKGYLDYLDGRLARGRNDPDANVAQAARLLLDQRFFKAGKSGAPRQARAAQGGKPARQGQAGTVQQGRRPLQSKKNG